MTTWNDGLQQAANATWPPLANEHGQELVCDLINEHAALRLQYEEETRKVTGAYAHIVERRSRAFRSHAGGDSRHSAPEADVVYPNNNEASISLRQNVVFVSPVPNNELPGGSSAGNLQALETDRPQVSPLGISENECEQLELSELRIHNYLFQLEELEVEIAGIVPKTPNGLIAKLRFFARLTTEGSDFASDVLPFVLDASMDHLEKMLSLKRSPSTDT